MCHEVLVFIKDKGWTILKFVKVNVWDPYMGLEGKVGNLKGKMERLISRRKDFMDEVEYAEHHLSKTRKAEFNNWQGDVQKLADEFKLFEENVQRRSKGLSRICLSNRADEIQKTVELLQELSKFPEGLFLNVVNEEKECPLVETNLKGQVFEENLGKVLVSLDEVSSIGIYGMGGVGKTTLATHIHDRLLKEPKYSGHVYWVTVSQDFSITKMQNAIAKILKLELSTEDDDRKRTAKLAMTLTRKKNFVLILDDVWTFFDVKKVGIPLGIGGGKLIITSRSVEVCEGIGCQKKVNVGTLSPTESWELFVETLNHSGDLPEEIEEIAKRMAKKCDGLPLGIITMAASMRGKADVSEWRVAFEEFKESCMQLENMNDKVLPILRCSYNRLSDPRLQKCFLYCCLYPEDHKIERDQLIRLFIVEELLDKKKSRKAEFDQGHAVLNKLERACLLESNVDSDGDRFVRMHDLVREMALQIARDEYKWMIKAGEQLLQMPEEQEWPEDLDKVSLMYNDIKEISQPLSHVHLRLTTLLLQRNYRLSVVVDSFFVQIPGLRVLDLTYTNIEMLPSSVSNLESLSALVLKRCGKLSFVPPLNKLKNLIELDLYGTRIKEVPQGLESLVNLRYLDIETDVPRFKEPAVDIFAQLSNLQSLSIRFVVRVEDLLGMGQLEAFHGRFVDVSSFDRFLKYRQSCGKPSSFSIGLNPIQYEKVYTKGFRDGNEVILKNLVRMGENAKMLCYDKIKEEEGGRDVTLLPLDTQVLKIEDCDLHNSCNSLSDALPSLIQSKGLKEIEIRYCKGAEFLFRFGEALPQVGTFSHLRDLKVYGCNEMKKLIPRWLLPYLQNLTAISIESCKKMEEILYEDEEEQVNQCGGLASSSSSRSKSINDAEVILPKLQILHLAWVPRLESIYKGGMPFASIKRLEFDYCPQLRRLPFTLPLRDGQPSAPPALERISIDEKEWESLKWDHPQYKNLLQPFVGYY